MISSITLPELAAKDLCAQWYRCQRGVENGLPKGRGFYPIYRQ